jgi:hypothetical protein
MKQLANKRIAVITLSIAVAVLASGIFQGKSSNASSTADWVLLGPGSMKAESVDSNWYLHSFSTVYLNIHGAKGKEKNS